jgi:hypothetical protein
VTSASTAVAAAISASATTAASAALSLGTGLINIECASSDFLTVQGGNSFFTVFGACHLHKSKSTGAASVPIGHDADPVHLPIGFKHSTEVFFRRIEIQVTYEDILHGLASTLSYLREEQVRPKSRAREACYGAGASDQFKCGGSIAVKDKKGSISFFAGSN